jgi:hypothetical protein
MFCTKLATVTIPATTPPTLGTLAFMGINNVILPNLRIEVPSASVAAYKAAANWSDYADRIFAIAN